jgi:hypothetical protein
VNARRVLVFVALALAVVPSGAQGKPGPDGLPSWLAAGEEQVLTAFGNPRTVAVFHLAYPRKIAVVFEFQDVVICRTCEVPPGHPPLQARVFRLSFDRATHAVNGEMRLCEIRGERPPLSRCLAR